MTISNFPAALVPIIQTGLLERKFEDALTSKIGYRAIADREEFAVRGGETITKTRAGLKAPATTALSPSANTNFDNGFTPSNGAIEQYTITLNAYGDSIDLNTVTDRVGLASQFTLNSHINGVQAAQTVDRLARNALFNPYMGGNTRVRVTLGSPNVAVSVDDIRGFQTVFVNGQIVNVSGTNTLLVTVGSNVYTLTGAAADGTNVSTAPNGISGVLTFSATVTVADATAGNTVTASQGSTILRPSGRANTSLLTSSDLLTMSVLLDARAVMEKNNIPMLDGAYNLYLDPVSARQLFADSDFRQLFQGATSSNGVYKSGTVVDMLGLRFMTTTEAFTQTLAGAGVVRRPIIAGAGALVEGVFAGLGATDTPTSNSIMSIHDGILQVTREPIDRLGQIIAQSWEYIGGFAAPSDVTANTNIVPTATNSAYKRAVIIEHIG